MWFIYSFLYLFIGWVITYLFVWLFYFKLRKKYRYEYNGNVLMWVILPFIWPIVIFYGFIKYFKICHK